MESQGVKESLQRLGAHLDPRSRERRSRLRVPRFSLIANNCWGAEVYKDLGLPFSTPFIGLFVPGPDFVRLASDHERILRSPLRFVEHSVYPLYNGKRSANKAYPLALLDDDVEVHFLHYGSEQEAQHKWSRRLARLAWDRLFWVFLADSDIDIDNTGPLRIFSELPLRKLALARDNRGLGSCCTTIPEYVQDGKEMYNISLTYLDIVEWLNQP